MDMLPPHPPPPNTGRTKAVAQRCSVKKGVLRNFAKFTRKQLRQSLFNKVAGPKPATLFKNRPWRRCFPVNFAKPLVAASGRKQDIHKTFLFLFSIKLLIIAYLPPACSTLPCHVVFKLLSGHRRQSRQIKRFVHCETS